MLRHPNTDTAGNSWPQETKDLIFTKAQISKALDPKQFRYDSCGYLISYENFGDRNEAMGWEIDHIQACANGGGDGASNLQPLN